MAQRDAIEAGILPLVPPPSPAVKAERQVDRLIREHGRRRIAELMTRYFPLTPIGKVANDNPAPSAGKVDLPAA
jgi:hypothetical protein